MLSLSWHLSSVKRQREKRLRFRRRDGRMALSPLSSRFQRPSSSGWVSRLYSISNCVPATVAGSGDVEVADNPAAAERRFLCRSVIQYVLHVFAQRCCEQRRPKNEIAPLPSLYYREPGGKFISRLMQLISSPSRRPTKSSRPKSPRGRSLGPSV